MRNKLKFLTRKSVKKYTSLLIIGYAIIELFSYSVISAQQPLLRSREFTRAKVGNIIESSILADDKGKVFIEVPENITVKTFSGDDDSNPTAFDGFIMAPQIIDLPEKFPISRYRPFVVFEFLADSGEDVRFTDQYFGLKTKQLRKLESRDESFVRKKIRAFFPISKTDQIQMPSLYFFDPERKNWKRLGGILEETSDPDKLLFTLSIARTGLFALVDENPSPIYSDEQNTDQSIIELAEESPFPTVITSRDDEDITFLPEEEYIIDESTDQLFENSPETQDIPSLQDNSGEIPASEPLSQEIIENSIPKKEAAPKSLEKKNIKDINYDPNQTTSFLDLYNTGGSNRPVLIYLHGGNWIGGSRKNLPKSMTNYFDSQNMIVAAIDFRAIQRVDFEQQGITFREQMSDIAKAVSWIHQNIAEYGGHPNDLHILGHGSGAHNAALLTTDPRFLNTQKVPHKSIQSIVALDAPSYDIPRAIASAASHSIPTMADTLITRFGNDVTQVEASPIAYLNQDKPYPSYLLVFTNDFPLQHNSPSSSQTLSEDQANHFATSLKEQNISVIVDGSPASSHGGLILNMGNPGDIVTQKIGNFYSLLFPEGTINQDPPPDKPEQQNQLLTTGELPLPSADKTYEQETDLTTDAFGEEIPNDAKLPQTGPITNLYLVLSLIFGLFTRYQYKQLKGYW